MVSTARLNHLIRCINGRLDDIRGIQMGEVMRTVEEKVAKRET